jgi:ankyrin repeat protein
LAPIHVAIQAKEAEVVQCLLRRGVDVKKSPLALNLAVFHGEIEIVSLLMKYGANPGLKNETGKTSFELLQLPEQREIEEVMRNTKERENVKGRLSIQTASPPVMTLSDLLDRLPPPPQRKVRQPHKVTKM